MKIINNSFGTNLKQVDERGNIVYYYYSGPELTTVHDIEYEYFLFKKQYNEGPSFVDAAWDAVKGKDVIQVFTNGNNDRANPYHRALYPYFNPEAEAQWIAIAGLKQVDSLNAPATTNWKLNLTRLVTQSTGHWLVRARMAIPLILLEMISMAATVVRLWLRRLFLVPLLSWLPAIKI